jgi:glycogen debranching enzyme
MSKRRLKKSSGKRGLRYRSKLEDGVAIQIQCYTTFEYETKKIPFVVSESRFYLPDFILPNGIHIEAKGYLRREDRKKLLLVKEQHPDLDLRLVFQCASNRIYKRSKTTYGQWAKKHGFLYSDNGRVPREWLIQPRKTLTL